MTKYLIVLGVAAVLVFLAWQGSSAAFWVLACLVSLGCLGVGGFILVLFGLALLALYLPEIQNSQ